MAFPITQKRDRSIVCLPLFRLQVVNGGLIVAPGAPHYVSNLVLLKELTVGQVFTAKAPHQSICNARRGNFPGELQERRQVARICQIANRHAAYHVTINSGHNFPFPAGCVQRWGWLQPCPGIFLSHESQNRNNVLWHPASHYKKVTPYPIRHRGTPFLKSSYPSIG